jgi:hypothetical protein
MILKKGKKRGTWILWNLAIFKISMIYSHWHAQGGKETEKLNHRR